MYAAHIVAAPSAHSTPEGLPDQRTSAMSSTPVAASSTAATSRGRREAAAATATGPQNSIATAVPNGSRAMAS
jgi:hypothetical protein